MVASKYSGSAANSLQLQRHLQPVQGSLTGRAGGRRTPWLMSLHRATDGTLAGLGLCMLALSGLTLHWQNEWGQSFQALESAQVLEHRLQESAAQLERHHLSRAGKPGHLVPTSSDRLIFMPPPPAPSPSASGLSLATLDWKPAAIGY